MIEKEFERVQVWFDKEDVTARVIAAKAFFKKSVSKASMVIAMRWSNNRKARKALVRRMAHHMRRVALQLCLYVIILAGALSVTSMGTDIMFQMVSRKMTAMGNDVIRLNMPEAIRTASLRPTLSE